MTEPETFRIVEPNGGTSLHWTIISSTRGTIAQAFTAEAARLIVNALRTAETRQEDCLNCRGAGSFPFYGGDEGSTFLGTAGCRYCGGTGRNRSLGSLL